MTSEAMGWVVRMPLNARPPKQPGETMLVSLEQTISGNTGRPEKGPHVCGRAEVLHDGRVRLEMVDTNAGRTAASMIKDDLLDVVLWGGTVRLRIHEE